MKTPKPIHPLFLNRSGIMLMHKAPYIAWADGLEIGGPKFKDCFDDAIEGLTIYLIPDVDTVEQARAYVRKHLEFFFCEELNQWCVAPDLWPEDRSWKQFKAWFDVRLHSMVVDTSDKMLVQEDWDRLENLEDDG